MEKIPYAGHADQCQGIHKAGQCMHKKVSGSNYCEMHGGSRAAKNNERQRIRLYKLTKFQNRVDEFAVNPKVKSLREEIGILRMTLEMLVNRCQDESDLIMFMPKIADTIMKIEKLVTSAHKLESQMGQLLDKMAAVQLSDSIVQIITDNIDTFAKKVMEKVPENLKDDIEHILSSELPNQIATDMADTIAEIGEEALEVS